MLHYTRNGGKPPSMGDVQKIGRVGGVTFFYYFLTTGISVVIGIILVNLIRPGAGVDPGNTVVPQVVEGKEGIGFSDTILSLLSPNIVRSVVVERLSPGEVIPDTGQPTAGR